jgi:ribonuclease HI
MIKVFTDGSSRGNPGPGGWGAILVLEDKVVELGGREVETTNNRMELTAVIESLKYLNNEHDIEINTDSAYVLNGSTRWVKGWKINNWKTSTKDDVLNKDLWEQMLELMTHRNLSWNLIKGHSGHSANERCDVIATSFADNSPVVLYIGSKDRYGVNLNSGVGSGEKTKSKSKSKAYSYVSMVDDEIQVHKTWDECKTRVNGKSGARFKKSTSPENEEEIIEEFSN